MVAAMGCARATSTPAEITPATIPSTVLTGLPGGAPAHATLCVNDQLHPNFPNDADVFIKVFCADAAGGTVPNPTSLVELEQLLGLGFQNPGGGNATGGNPGFALLGHSESLAGRYISAINPRAILFTPLTGSRPSGYVLLAYTRGDTFVEVAAHDPTLDKVILYLVRFAKGCAANPGGCTPADLLTSSVEQGWLAVDSYAASTDINDTILDCFECHQPAGPSGPTVLRMQEITPPFTHFFSSTTEGGKALVADFHSAHGSNEAYAGIPAPLVDESDPALLAGFLQAAGFGDQPNAFDSAAIEAEVRNSAPRQPLVNVPLGESHTWDGIYAVAKLGQAIAVPYHDVKVTDATKLAAATNAYRKVSLGQASPNSLMDIRDVFLDQGLRDMGFAPADGLDGHALLVQVCQQCHNSHLDQTISRALFNVEILGALPRSRKNEAIRRLNITNLEDPSKMPPPLFRTLTSDERQRIIDVLNE
jgi:hypothetical protein